jgi:phosphate-selective porin O/P
VQARPLPLVTAALVGLAGIAAAQVPNIRVSGRMQAQFRAASGDSSGSFNPNTVNSNFEIRRLRIQTEVRFGDNMLAVIQPSFEMGSLRMRDAFLRVGLTPQIGVTIGQEKSPFQRYELNSSNTLPSIERGLRILGLSGREGLNDLLANNGYASHDLGAFVDYAAPANKFTVKVGMANGSRESAADVNNAKSFFGRATAVVMTNADDQPELQVGASFAARDRAICSTCAGTIVYYADSSKMTSAFGLDFEWGGFRPGLHVFGDFATGDNARNRISSGRNTANLVSSSDTNIVTFMGLSLVGAYRIMTQGPETRVVKMIEPALRLDYLDPDTDTDDDQGILLTPVLNVYFGNTVALRAGLDLYSYKTAAGTQSAREFKVSWQANF